MKRLIESIGGQDEQPTQDLSPYLIARFLASPIWQGIGGLAAIAAIFLTIVLAQNNANQPTPTPPPTTQTAVVPSHTLIPPTSTDVPPTNTSIRPTPTPIPPTDTVAPTLTVAPPTPASTSGLVIGEQAVIAPNSDGYLNLRSAIGRDNPVLAQVPVGSAVLVLDGPTYAEDLLWWKVRAADGVVGWKNNSNLRKEPKN